MKKKRYLNVASIYVKLASVDNTYHTVILGGGPGGVAAATALGAAGKKTAIVNSELGGECLNWGCIPTKSLLWGVELFEKIQKSKLAGIEAKSVRINFAQMMKRKSQIVSLLSQGVEFNLKKANVELIAGYGEIITEHQIKVSGKDGSSRLIETDHIIIATGSATNWLPNTEKSGNVIDNRDLLSLTEIPPSLVIIGGGVVGCEFASLFMLLGAKVTIIEYADRLLPNEDTEISALLEKIFTRQGIGIYTSSKVTKVTEKGDMVEIAFEKNNGETIVITAAKALMAAGRKPVIPQCAPSIRVGRCGIETNEQMQTNIDTIYAIGDVAGKALLAYTAEREGEIAAAHILSKPFEGTFQRPINYHHVPSAIFCEPNIASIGLTEARSREQGLQLLVGKSTYAANSKALIMGEREGLVKLIFDAKSKRFIGAHILGFGAPDFIMLFSLAAHKNLGLDDFRHILFPHPVVSEVIKEAIENIEAI